MEGIILAGGKATRLGDAARGQPKALVPIAGHPLAEYQVSQLVRAGVERVVSLAALSDDLLSILAMRRPGQGEKLRAELLGTLDRAVDHADQAAVAMLDPDQLSQLLGLLDAIRARQRAQPDR